MDVLDFYSAQIVTLQQEINNLKKKKRNFGLGRLISFLGAIVLFFVLLEFNGVWAIIVAIILLSAFIFITTKDIDNLHRLKFKQVLLTINEDEVKALQNDFSAFDDGDRFRDQTHPYSNDLDIFGRHSLFQWINRTTAAPAAHLLAARLSSPLEKETVLQVQDAVKELQPETDWRQQLQAIGMQSKMNEDVYTQIKGWIEREGEQAENKKVIGSLVIAFPVITLLIIILASFHILPWKILWISFCAHLLLLWRVNKIVTPEYEFLSEAINAIDSFYGAIQWVTQKKFQSSYLQKIQNKCYKEGHAAFQLLDKLKRTLHKMHLRLNPLVHFPLNLCVFWDWYQYRKLTLWRNKYSSDLSEWVKVYAEMEVLSSFANMAFNHPGWCYPEIDDQHFMLSAKALGHPLIPDDKRVCNDLQLNGTGKIMLVTGSNMAGKSTFLRTVGVNMILAMAGSSVCAKEMFVSTVKIISSMRIADNLEENISTFYAELKKLEFILQKVRAHEKVFLLLDEILRGTNSQDRHTGAKALIKQFLHEEAVGILATHDLELTGMGNEYKNQILNYHFDAEVQDQELYFDYKLKPGICTSMNASLLMRKIGIEV
ncbi:MAG: hypothetical protein EPN37_18910 [Chitinophagaceae bacterium]|nr:MAG: hypothetical protein EPN37_18910 [Chitinophagaceae bacterium]